MVFAIEELRLGRVSMLADVKIFTVIFWLNTNLPFPNR